MGNDNKEFIVVDAPPGEGKTTLFINRMESSPEHHKWMFVTPFLKETRRIQNSCPSKNFQLPTNNNLDGSKSSHLEKLLEAEENVSITHQLFKNITPRSVEALKKSGKYILVLDEVFDALTEFDLFEERTRWRENKKSHSTKEDMNWLIDNGHVSIGEDYKIVAEKEISLSKYNKFWNAVKREVLFYSRNTLLYSFIPIELFDEVLFTERWLLTYQFNYSTMDSFFKYVGVPYKKMSVVGKYPNYELSKYKSNGDEEWKASLLSNLDIVRNHRINEVGNPYLTKSGWIYSALSNSWYLRRRNYSAQEQIQRNIRNFFENMAKEKSTHKMWATFKDAKKRVSGKGVTSPTFVAINLRATNEYRHKKAIAYPINRYISPFLNAIYDSHGISVHEDGYAVAEMLQFLLRSRLRDGKRIDTYIPSYRMRHLLINELSGKRLDGYKTEWENEQTK